MDKPELLKIIKQGEGQTIEFKEKLSEETGKAACAFANTNDGYILVGVNDQGILTGTSEREDKAAQLISAVSPRIYPRIYRIPIDQKTVMAIRIEKSPILTTYKNIPYVRIAATTQSLSFTEALAFAYGKGMMPFDSVLNPEIKHGGLDLETIQGYRSEMERLRGKKFALSDTELLESIGCIKNGALTNGGALLFCENPQQHYPSAYLSVARYEGSDVSERYLEIRQFHGNLFRQINDASAYLEEHNSRAGFLEGPVRVDVPAYPLFALRELLINAIAHRDYSMAGSHITIKWFSNRIEYYSPGGLLPPLTVESILKKQKSRNPLIVDVLHREGYIESLGDGLDRVFAEVKKHPLRPPAPRLEDLGDAFIATIYAANLNLLKYHELISQDERYRSIIETLTENKDGAGAGRLAASLATSTDSVLRLIDRLLEKGAVRREGVGRGVVYKLV